MRRTTYCSLVVRTNETNAEPLRHHLFFASPFPGFFSRRLCLWHPPDRIQMALLSSGPTIGRVLPSAPGREVLRKHSANAGIKGFIELLSTSCSTGCQQNACSKLLFLVIPGRKEAEHRVQLLPSPCACFPPPPRPLTVCLSWAEPLRAKTEMSRENADRGSFSLCFLLLGGRHRRFFFRKPKRKD